MNGPANLSHITVSNSSFRDAFLPGALLVGAYAPGVDFSGAPLLPAPRFVFPARAEALPPACANPLRPHLHLLGAYLQLAEFRGAHLEGGSFRKAQITDANFDWAYLDSTDFTMAVGRGKASWFGIRGSPTGLLVA